MGFGDDIAKFNSKAMAKADEERRSITITLFNGIISDTPVDTGILRGNWQITENQPATSTLNRTDKNNTVAQGDVLSFMVGSKGRDSVVYMTNNLPYAHRIEFDGYSQKAPQGMVRRNIARVNSIVARIARGSG